MDSEERPLVPPKIKTIRIIENPFDDIVPRITAAEKKAQQQAKLEAKRDMEARAKKAKALKKNTGLLSFGEAEEVPEEPSTRKKGLTRQDRKSNLTLHEAYIHLHQLSKPPHQNPRLKPGRQHHRLREQHPHLHLILLNQRNQRRRSISRRSEHNISGRKKVQQPRAKQRSKQCRRTCAS